MSNLTVKLEGDELKQYIMKRFNRTESQAIELVGKILNNEWVLPDYKPDSEFKYRVVSSYGGHKLSWHSLDCATGKNAKYSKRTALTPDERRDNIKARNVERFGHEGYVSYRDNMSKCCLDKDREQSPTFTRIQAKRLFDQALAEGVRAGNAAEPVPMVVGTPTTFLGNDIDYDKKTYYVADGVCGFAWVVIRPGNSSLARHAIKLGIGHSNRYSGGVEISVREHGQSLDRKSQHATAYAAILKAANVNAYAQSRID